MKPVLFSERNGYVSPKNILQIASMDDRLRICIYNGLYTFIEIMYSDIEAMGRLLHQIWCNHWYQPADKAPDWSVAFKSTLKNSILSAEWYEPYDLLEFVANCVEEIYDRTSWSGLLDYDCGSMKDDFCAHMNKYLELGGSGYRMIDGSVTPITNELELETLEESLHLPGKFSGAHLHISKAIELLSIKPEADAANAIKEAISAVESAAKVIQDDQKATLGSALKTLAQEGWLHPALHKGWATLYGFTSDADGIRHAAMNDSVEIDPSLARYMVVSCSAFVNYLVEHERERARSGYVAR